MRFKQVAFLEVIFVKGTEIRNTRPVLQNSNAVIRFNVASRLLARYTKTERNMCFKI